MASAAIQYENNLLIREKWATIAPEAYEYIRFLFSFEFEKFCNTWRNMLKTEAEKMIPQEKLVKLYERLYQKNNTNKYLVQQYTRYLDCLAWYQLFAKKFKDSEITARRLLELDATQNWIKTKLAHALLFQGKYEEAESIYLTLKLQKNERGKSYTTILEEDFSALEQAGITLSHIKKIQRLLKQ